MTQNFYSRSFFIVRENWNKTQDKLILLRRGYLSIIFSTLICHSSPFRHYKQYNLNETSAKYDTSLKRSLYGEFNNWLLLILMPSSRIKPVRYCKSFILKLIVFCFILTYINLQFSIYKSLSIILTWDVNIHTKIWESILK